MMRDTTPRPAGVHSRTLFTLALAALLALGLSAGQAAAHDPCRPIQAECLGAAGNAGDVTAGEGQFWLGTAPFRFVGTNAYFMHDATSYEAPDGPHRAGEMMHVANDLGFTVLRMWGFMNADGSGNNNGSVDQRLLQPLPGVYNDGDVHTNLITGQSVQTVRNHFADLDYVLATANAHNVRVIFTFGNNWKEYGGIAQYLKWCPGDVPPDQRKPIHFYTHPQCIALYQGYIGYVLDRPNSINGRTYRDDPTIFAWELMNEPRCQGCQFNEEALGPRPAGSPPRTVHEWMGDMATFIKGRGATQMVATGEEGFDCTWKSTWVALGYQDSGNIRLHPWMYDGSQGLCYGKNTRIADIDFGSFHIWPEYWRFKNGAESEASWIRDHILIAKAGQQVPGDESAWNGTWGGWGGSLAKPAVLGEFGSSRSNRATQYDGWLTAVAQDEPGWPSGAHGDGALVWQIMCPLCKNHATRLEVIFPPVSNESATLCTHANQFNGAPVTCSPTQPYAEPEIRLRR